MRDVTNSVPPVADRRMAAAETPTMQLTRDLAQYLRDYTRERPDVVAYWCFGLGFLAGWKLRR